jgi:3-hydroxy acid dehydrogenase/malonic semialdehyde reductase|tara:strand:- start:508 stop:1116 length:609 start_codon:yes stop_codon:yes gene_type:complete
MSKYSKVLISGTTSGIGYELVRLLDCEVIELNRDIVDLDYPEKITECHIPTVDVVINNAGHDVGGKVLFADHDFLKWQRVINTNLISAMRISQLAVQKNPNLTVINITSTNNDKYWGNDLVYSLSKVALEHFGKMLEVDYPKVTVKEARIGLTKTEFNNNRYKENHMPINDLYSNPYLTPEEVASKIVNFLNCEEKNIKIAL